METRKQKLERQLKDLDALILSLREDVDADLLEHCSKKRSTLVFEIAHEKYSVNNKLPYEQELLTILMEECGEVIQACSKIIRFGATDEKLKDLQDELGDLYYMMELAHQYDLVSWTAIDERANVKKEKLKKYSDLVGEYD